MVLKTVLSGKTYAFRDIKEVLAKANEEKTGDKLAGIAAQSAQERVAAKDHRAVIFLRYESKGHVLIAFAFGMIVAALFPYTIAILIIALVLVVAGLSLCRFF